MRCPRSMDAINRVPTTLAINCLFLIKSDTYGEDILLPEKMQQSGISRSTCRISHDLSPEKVWRDDRGQGSIYHAQFIAHDLSRPTYRTRFSNILCIYTLHIPPRKMVTLTPFTVQALRGSGEPAQHPGPHRAERRGVLAVADCQPLPLPLLPVVLAQENGPGRFPQRFVAFGLHP